MAGICPITMTILLLRLTCLTAARGSKSWSPWQRVHEEPASTERVVHNFVNDLATQRRWFLDPSLSVVSVLLSSAFSLIFRIHLLNQSNLYKKILTPLFLSYRT